MDIVENPVMNETPLTVVFASSRLLPELPRDSESAVVYLVPSLELGSLDAELNLSPVVNRVAEFEYDLISGEVEHEWQQVKKEYGADFAYSMEFVFKTLCTPLVYWKRVVAHSLEAHQPQYVWLPDGQARSVELRDCLDEFLWWGMHRTLENTGDGSPAKITARVRRVDEIFPVRTTKIGFDSVVDAIVGFKRLISRTSGSVGRWLSLLLHRNKQSPRVLVHCQERKSWELRRILRSLGANFSTSYVAESLLQKVSWKQVPLPAFSQDDTALDGLRLYISEVFKSVRAALPIVDVLTQESWTTLLTDAEHDPVVRLLIRESLLKGKRVGLVPEGAQSRMTDSVFPYFSSIYVLGSGATRFTLNEAQDEYATDLGESTLLTGFLGDTRRPFRTLRPFSWLVRKFAVNQNYAGIATLNLEYGYSWGMARAGDETAELHLNSAMTALSVLREHGWLVLVSSKSGRYTRALRQKLAARGTWVFRRIPWQILAKSSDVLIQRDSGLGHECQVLGVPVIVWDDFNYPKASRDLPHDPLRGVWHTSSTSELATALKEVVEISQTHKQNAVDLTERNARIKSWLTGGMMKSQENISVGSEVEASVRKLDCQSKRNSGD